MDLPPFLLDHWLARHSFASPPIAYDLASSTGPKWTVGELLSLGNGKALLDEVKIGYAPPEGGRELREAIAGFLGVDPDWIVVTTGASEALSILLCLAARRNGNLLLSSLGFSAFEAMAKAWGLGTTQYQLARQNDYLLSAGDVLAAADEETVLALVNTPHNPTGAVMPRDEIVRLAAALAERRVPLVVDEVYYPLYFDTAPQSAASIDNVIVIGDMSKALSLAGLRMGWIVDANAERRSRIIDARSYFTISSSPILEALAAHALLHHEVLLARLRAVATANLDALSAHMLDVADTWSGSGPSAGPLLSPGSATGATAVPSARLWRLPACLLRPATVSPCPNICVSVSPRRTTGFPKRSPSSSARCGSCEHRRRRDDMAADHEPAPDCRGRVAPSAAATRIITNDELASVHRSSLRE